MMWSLCLTSSQGRKIVKMEPTATVQALYTMAEEQFGKSVASLKYGFPPKLASSSNSQMIQEILQNQERIQVELEEKTKATKKGTNTKKSKGSNEVGSTLMGSSAENSPRKPKRAAAQRATENMPAVIRAQEESLKQQQQTSRSNKRARPSNTVSASQQQRKPQPRPKFNSSVGEGRRLADGAAIAAPKGGGGGRKKKSILEDNGAQKSSDMSEALLGALNDSGKMGQVLRKGMKNAVQASYETSRAFSRLAAIQAKKYTLTQEAGASSLSVTYQGSVDKSKTTEQVDCIPRDVLEEVLKGIHVSNQEALRPENLALLSPRVLWSLVHTFPDHTEVSAMYEELLPGVSWAFLRRRAQQLSEKALENLRQQQSEGEEVDGDHALEVVAAVEHAMEHLHDYTVTERKARLANAALSRLNASQESSTTTTTTREWVLTTPSEPDRDELRDCIQAAEKTSNAMSTLISNLMGECHIHNWRELANAEDIAGIAKKLGESIECVQSWVDYAQGQSVDEIIVEICDSSVRAVELLTKKARSGTPKDLAVWRSIPQMLHQRLIGEEEVPTVDDLRSWSERSFKLLQKFEWLNWYATPVE